MAVLHRSAHILSATEDKSGCGIIRDAVEFRDGPEQDGVGQKAQRAVIPASAFIPGCPLGADGGVRMHRHLNAVEPSHAAHVYIVPITGVDGHAHPGTAAAGGHVLFDRGRRSALLAQSSQPARFVLRQLVLVPGAPPPDAPSRAVAPPGALLALFSFQALLLSSFSV